MPPEAYQKTPNQSVGLLKRSIGLLPIAVFFMLLPVVLDLVNLDSFLGIDNDLGLLAFFVISCLVMLTRLHAQDTQASGASPSRSGSVLWTAILMAGICLLIVLVGVYLVGAITYATIGSGAQAASFSMLLLTPVTVSILLYMIFSLFIAQQENGGLHAIGESIRFVKNKKIFLKLLVTSSVPLIVLIGLGYAIVFDDEIMFFIALAASTVLLPFLHRALEAQYLSARETVL